MRWFRLYAEMIHDPKTGTLTDSEFRTWIELLCIACEQENNGNTGNTAEQLNWTLRRNVTETLPKLLQRNLIHENSQNEVCITQWEKRQFKSDTSAERVRKHRENKRKIDCNVTETLPKRRGNGLEQNRTDTEKNKILTSSSDEVYITKKKRKLRGLQLTRFLRFWDAFDYKLGKAEASDVWIDLSPDEPTTGKIITAALAEAGRRPMLKEQGRTPKMAQGWLSGRRWEDESEEGNERLSPDEQVKRKLGIH